MNNSILNDILYIFQAHGQSLDMGTKTHLRRAARRELNLIIGQDQPSFPLDEIADKIVRIGIKNGLSFIHNIKAVRDKTKWNLRDSKEFVEKYFLEFDPQLKQRPPKPEYL